MNSYQSIVEWAANELSDWEADLVRRLLLKGSLEPDDVSQITRNAICSFNINEPSETKECHPPTLVPESIDNITSTSPIKLCCIDSVTNINAIHETAKLPFSHNGLTLVYGDNGSGKSGYSRILKGACFAKHIEPTVLGNIYKPLSTAQSAKITFLKNGNREEWQWSPGKSLTDLTTINVFDTDCGKALLDKNNQVTYKPRGAEIFDKISPVMDSIKTTIDSRKKDATPPSIPGLEENLELNSWFKAITEKSKVDAIQKNLTWTLDDQTSLTLLSKNITDYENGATVKTIEKIKSIVDIRLPRAITKLSKCIDVLSISKPAEIQLLRDALVIAQKTYETSLIAFDVKEPLNGVHSDPWKNLLKAAQEYSEQHAYVGKDFPYTGDEALCVLCMQPLHEHAEQRLSRFENYIKDKSKTLFDTAKQNLSEAEKLITDLTVPEPEAYEPLSVELIELLEIDGGLAEAFRAIKTRKEFLTQKDQAEKQYNDTTIIPLSILENLSVKLNEKLAELQANTSPEKHAKDKETVAKQTLKKALSSAATSILSYHQALISNRKIATALNAIKQTKTRFSSKAKAIIAQLVTPDFIENFKDELSRLGVNLIIDITPLVRDSDTSHSFSIGSQKPGRVLSEGEQKVISLAAYLAEMKTFGNVSPLVLDDPVSSLDHVYREKIALRLTQEALNRQLIIFTHDLALIMEIEGKCTELVLSQGVRPALSSFTVRRNGKDSGFCLSEAPWRGMTTAQRAHHLDTNLNSFKQFFEIDTAQYNEKAALLYCLLREAWESLIEQDLFFDIVSRGRNSIQTTRIGQIIIEPEDANKITSHMTTASTWMYGHDKSKAVTENRPAPKQIAADVEELRTFAKAISTRRKSAKSAFEEQFDSPVCEVG
jgi:energy-coupling factor transporter ATP-binding protein EcfA2